MTELKVVDHCKKEQKWIGVTIPVPFVIQQAANAYIIEHKEKVIKQTPANEQHITLIYWGSSDAKRWESASRMVAECGLRSCDVEFKKPRFIQPKFDKEKKFNSGFVVCDIVSPKIERLARLLRSVYPADEKIIKRSNEELYLHLTIAIVERHTDVDHVGFDDEEQKPKQEYDPDTEFDDFKSTPKWIRSILNTHPQTVGRVFLGCVFALIGLSFYLRK